MSSVIAARPYRVSVSIICEDVSITPFVYRLTKCDNSAVKEIPLVSRHHAVDQYIASRTVILSHLPVV